MWKMRKLNTGIFFQWWEGRVLATCSTQYGSPQKYPRPTWDKSAVVHLPPACYPATGCLGGLSSLFREWQKIPGVPQNFESLSQHAMRAVNQELQLQNFMTFIESSDFCTISNVLFFPLSWVIRKIDTTK